MIFTCIFGQLLGLKVPFYIYINLLINLFGCLEAAIYKVFELVTRPLFTLTRPLFTMLLDLYLRKLDLSILTLGLVSFMLVNMGGDGMNEVVKYDNILNHLSFRNFTENDFNLFMCLCARLRDLGDEAQVYEYDYLMDMIGWDKSQRIDLFHDEIKRMTDKLRQIGGTIDISPDEFVSFNLFDTFRGNKQKRRLTVSVNPKFKFVLNDLTKNFTRFELSEYVNLNGRYSKLLYQHLKQYRKTGWWQVSVDDIRHELSIPNSMKTMHILTKVLSPSIDVIKSCKGFGKLQVEVLRSPRRGRKVEGYKFTWTADKQIPGQMSLDDFQNTPPKKKKVSKKKADFEQNTYDFEELEKRLLKN